MFCILCDRNMPFFGCFLYTMRGLLLRYPFLVERLSLGTMSTLACKLLIQSFCPMQKCNVGFDVFPSRLYIFQRIMLLFDNLLESIIHLCTKSVGQKCLKFHGRSGIYSLVRHRKERIRITSCWLQSSILRSFPLAMDFYQIFKKCSIDRLGVLWVFCSFIESFFEFL